MFSDVVDLRDFYKSRLGRMVVKVLRQKLKALWPDIRNDRILGLGYAVPYLPSYFSKAERVIAAMPAGQGVLPWPTEEANASCLVEPSHLPFPDYSMDKILLIHYLEGAEQLQQVLRECWRTLSDGGSLLIVVPNRRGIWARVDKTPFGHGTPFSRDQLDKLLRENMFTPTQCERGLYMPPTDSRLALSLAPVWQWLGRTLFERFSGVILMEAKKQIYAGNVQPAKAKARKFVPVVKPIPKS